jgi:hypothetical protein
MARSHTKDTKSKRISKVVLRWTTAGKKKRGKPKTSWRRTVEFELKEIGLSSCSLVRRQWCLNYFEFVLE